MVGNTSQQTKKEKKEKKTTEEQAAQQKPSEKKEKDDGDKRTSNPQTPKQNKQIDLDKAADPPKQNNSYPYQHHYSNSGKKSRYKGKGFDANGRPRNFYNPPGKVMRHLAQ